jgi:ABC-type spermidine/putrescine transport system permease subunit I
LPKLASVLALVYGLQAMLSTRGVVNAFLLTVGFVHEPVKMSRNLTGALVCEIYLLLPYPVLMLVVSLARIDSRLVAVRSSTGERCKWTRSYAVAGPLSSNAAADSTLRSRGCRHGVCTVPE